MNTKYAKSKRILIQSANSKAKIYKPLYQSKSKMSTTNKEPSLIDSFGNMRAINYKQINNIAKLLGTLIISHLA